MAKWVPASFMGLPMVRCAACGLIYGTRRALPTVCQRCYGLQKLIETEGQEALERVRGNRPWGKGRRK